MFVPHPDVLFRQIDDESVLLDLGSGTYFGLNEVATRVWQLAQEAVDEDAAVGRLAAEFEAEPETIRRDVRALIGELEERRLIVRRGPAPA